MKTSYYANLKNIDKSTCTPVAISGDEGKMVNFVGKACRNLSPYVFFKKWKAIEVDIEEKYKQGIYDKEKYQQLKEQNQDDYIKKFYKLVLSKQNPQAVYKNLGENAVLLCFEKPTDFCHRFLVAGWLEYHLNIKVDEYGFEKDRAVVENKTRLKEKLVEVIKQNELNK